MKFSTTTVTVICGLLSCVEATIYYAGVAESGGEFGVPTTPNAPASGNGLPGIYSKDFAFIDRKAIDVFVDTNKINFFRIAFLLERMCPPSTGLGGTFDETHWGHFLDDVNYVTKTKGAYVLLDPHNYMRYAGQPSQHPFSGSLIGDTLDPKAPTTAQWGAFWGEIAKRFRDNEKVMFGLMNEPHDMKSALLVQNLQAAIDAIRGANATGMIVAPGNSWDGGHAWTQGGSDASSNWLNKLKDPLGNTAIDVHEYLDQDFSGSHLACTQDPETNLRAVTSWLTQNNLKAILTEFGGSNTTQCATMLNSLLTYLDAHPEWIGWTGWAAGPLWGTHSPCCTDGRRYGPMEPGSKAEGGGPSLYDTVWVPMIQPHVPKQLQWSGPASVKGGPLSTRT